MKQKIINCSGGLLILFGILPFMLNISTLCLIAGGLILLSSNCWPARWRRFLMPVFLFCLIFALIYLSILGYFAYGRQPEPSSEQTVVVLGCKVNGDRPSRMLKRRLDTAVEYLQENPSLPCVVTGGQGYNEAFPEALVMKAYLLEQGIAEERIFVEDKSSNTRENLQFSRSVILANGLSENLTIISDGFHQCRAFCIARKLGMESHAISANTSLWLVPAYAFREVLSFIKLLPFLLS